MKYWMICLFMAFGTYAHSEDSAGSGSRSPDAYQLVSGDSSALQRLDTLFDQIGGREIWAQARSLQLIQKMRNPKIGDGIVSMTWHDLEGPGEWGDVQHPELKVRYAWSKSGGWLSRDGNIRDFVADEVAEKAFYWIRDLYTLYHKIAEDKTSFVIERLPPFGVTVRNDKLEKIAELHLTRTGQLYRWRLLGGEKDHDTIFGPYRSFGTVHFPEWMASADGRWGALQIQVTPSAKPFNEQVSLKKPAVESSVADWKGGAVHSNCDQ